MTTCILCNACIKEASVLVDDLDKVTIVRGSEEECEFCRFAEEKGETRRLTEEELQEAEEMRRRGEL